MGSRALVTIELNKASCNFKGVRWFYKNIEWLSHFGFCADPSTNIEVESNPSVILSTPKQLRELAEMAHTYGRGYAEITTRQDLQLHWIDAEK
ncbi:hypothetical protein KEJ39_01065, partial [Candidatus Bathyarchaeota archaeon]|nr:hypothetical protein [Candidatus Bathyarchaeota archaeon]